MSFPLFSLNKNCRNISMGMYAIQFLTIIFLATDGVLIFAQREKSSFDPSCFASGSFQTLWLWFLKVLSPCKGKGSSFNSKKKHLFHFESTVDLCIEAHQWCLLGWAQWNLSSFEFKFDDARDFPHNIRIRLAQLKKFLLLPDVALSLPCWLSQFIF